MRLLNWLFGVAEEINGGDRCPTYLFRWTLLNRPWGKVYLHHFVGDDWSLDHHDHPKRFISVGLWGWYLEHTPDRPPRRWHAAWIRSFPAEYIHRLTVPSKNCWTLVIVGRPEREWGFWHLGRFIPWRAYVNSEMADKAKACD